MTDLASRVAAGDRLSIAKAISLIENEQHGYQDLLDSIHNSVGKAYRIGVTGPPGAGKSTFTSQLTKQLRKDNKRVGIVAIDPTSPFSGGAILGDRVRMAEISIDKDVFIRSMATRGSMGGLARQAVEVADVLDAAGFNTIIFETVGVGQVEIDIANAADTTVVMFVPESGDAIQGMKAGLMEIGDLFLVNKADRPGAERLIKDLEYVLHLKSGPEAWDPPVLQTVAIKGEGIAESSAAISRHREFLESSDLLHKQRRTSIKKRIEMLIEYRFYNFFWNDRRKKILDDYLRKNSDAESLYSMADKLFDEIKK